MSPSGYPQLSVAVDSLGDVFLYREAGFLDRPGNDKFKAGTPLNKIFKIEYLNQNL